MKEGNGGGDGGGGRETLAKVFQDLGGCSIGQASGCQDLEKK